MGKVKFGVIGLGWFGEYHADVIAGLPHAELTALCTRTPSRLEELGSKYQVENCYTDYQDLLDNPEIEAVTIATMWDQDRKSTRLNSSHW